MREVLGEKGKKEDDIKGAREKESSERVCVWRRVTQECSLVADAYSEVAGFVFVFVFVCLCLDRSWERGMTLWLRWIDTDVFDSKHSLPLQGEMFL